MAERPLHVRYTPAGAPGASRLVVLNVSPLTAIGQIKLELLVELGIDLPLQKLTMGSVVLEDERTIDELKLSHADELTLYNLADEAEDVPPLANTPDTRRDTAMERIDLSSALSAGSDAERGKGRTGSVVVIDSDDEEEAGRGRASGALVGLRNQGATCYLNVLVQALFLTPEFRAMLYAIPTAPRAPPAPAPPAAAPASAPGAAGGAKGEKGEAPLAKDELIYQLQLLFAQLQAGVCASASTEGLTRSFGWGSSELGVQHDVHELNRVLCDRLEELMRALPADCPPPPFSIASLYRGAVRSTVACQHCGYSSGRDEELYDVPLVVKGHADVYECLDAFARPELLDGDNAYSCERCAVKRPATRALAFRTLPTILNLQLLRFEYEPSTGRREKVAHTVLFPALLAMDKYMLPADAAADAAPPAAAPTAAAAPAAAPAAATDASEEALREGEEEVLVRGRVLYELVGVLVHCGTASVGHYLAFVYSLEQRKWFRFNDEVVTPLDAADILAHRWLDGSAARADWALSAALTQPAPYMLLYRRRHARPLPPRPGQAEGTHRVALAPVAFPRVSDEDIPRHIHTILVREAARQAAEQLERKTERELVNITVHRNRTWLPSLSVRAHPLSTLEMLRAEVVMQAESHDEQAIMQHSPLTAALNPRYRLRRMVARENDTTRPGNAFVAADEGSTLEALRVADKRAVYLEQDNVGYADEADAEAADEGHPGRIFLTVRRWDERAAAPADLADVLVPKRSTVAELRQLIARRFNLGPPAELLLVEEVTEERFNLLLDDAATLDKCGLLTGDLIYAERITDKHYRHTPAAQSPALHSLVQEYRQARRDQLTVWFEETHSSFKARTKPGGGPELAPEWRDKKAKVGCTTYGGNTVAQVRDYVAGRLGVAAEYLRFRALDPKGVREARLVKEATAVFAEAITVGEAYATDLQLIVLPAPEALRKGDKVLEVRFYNDTGAFVLTADVVLNKHAPMRDLKRQLAGQFGVPPERQLLSEWYDNRLYQVFANGELSLAQYRIHNGDVLRLDALPPEAQEVGGAEAAVALQVVVGAGWNLTASGHKELAFRGPYIVTVRLAATRAELEALLRARCKLHDSAPLQLFRPSRLPITEADLRPMAPLPLRALDAASAALVSAATTDAGLPLRVFDVHNCDILALLVDLPRAAPAAAPAATDTAPSAPPERPKELSLVIK